jgi:transposase
MPEEGKAPAEAARRPSVAAQTVRRWRRDCRAGGRSALVSLLVEAPTGCGFAGRHLWAQQPAAGPALREFGVSYHHSHFRVALGAMGLTRHKPRRRAREREEATSHTTRA